MLKKRAMNKSNNTMWIIVAAVLLITCDTENNVKPGFPDFFIKYYGGTGNQGGVDMIEGSNGEIYLLGNSDSEKGKKFFVTKIDSTGKILAQQYFGDPDPLTDEVAVDIEPAYDGNFIIAIQKRISATERDIKLLQISSDLVGIDSTTRTFGGDDEIKSVTTLGGAQRGFVMTGSTTADLFNDGISDVTDPFILKVDEGLDIFDPLWRTAGGGGQLDVGIKIYEYKGANPFVSYVLFFSSNPTGTGGDLDFYYIGINEFGGGEGDRQPLSEPNSSSEVLSQVIEDVSLGYILVGTSSTGNGPKSMYNSVFSLDLSGSAQNQGNQLITGESQDNLVGISAAVSANSGYLLLGNQETQQNNTTNSNIILLKRDLRGNAVWSSSFGADYLDKASKVIELSNGKILILGTVTLGNQEKVVLIKVNSMGQFAP